MLDMMLRNSSCGALGEGVVARARPTIAAVLKAWRGVGAAQSVIRGVVVLAGRPTAAVQLLAGWVSVSQGGGARAAERIASQICTRRISLRSYRIYIYIVGRLAAAGCGGRVPRAAEDGSDIMYDAGEY